MKKLDILLLLILTFNSYALDKPNFRLIDTNGEIYTKQSTDGKFLIVNFWTTWCPPCIEEIPDLVDFYKKYKNQVQILGMNYENTDDDDKKIKFRKSLMINYPIFLMPQQSKQFNSFTNIAYMPTTLIYDKSGKLIRTFVKKITLKQLKNIIFNKTNIVSF